MIDWNVFLPGEWPTALAMAGTILAALGGAAAWLISHSYERGKNAGERDLKIQETVSNLDMAGLSQQMRDAAANLRDVLGVYDENKRLQVQVTSLSSERNDCLEKLSRMRDDLHQNKQMVDNLKQELGKFQASRRSFTMTAGEADEIAPKVILGLNQVLAGFAYIKLQNEDMKLSVGSVVDVHSGGQICQLVVLSIDNSFSPRKVKFELMRHEH